MHPITYARATDVPTAIRLLGDGAKFLAGGTTLVDLMKLNVETPARLVDIRKLNVGAITATDAGVEIGAAATNTAVADHAAIRERFPALSQAILAGASQQIRNMASVGGNLLQRTRCPYFRDGVSPCNKRSPGAGCSAKDGESHNLAVLGVSDACYATHPSDMAVALAALDAVVRVQGPNGRRDVPIGEFHTLPGDAPHVESVLAADEMIVGVFVPASPFARRSAYLKTRDRASYEFALASCAAAVEIDAGTIKSARVALGGVGTKPWRSPEAEGILTGQKPTDELFRNAADAALAGPRPLTGNAYKVDLAKRVIVKTLKAICG